MKFLPLSPTAPPKPVRTQGIVEWFSPEKGYGLIRQDASKAEYFVTFTDIASPGYRMLEPNSRVEFEPAKVGASLVAHNVTRV